MEFTANIESSEKWKSAAFVIIPFDVKKEFGSGRPKVKAIFDGSVAYRGILSKMGDPFHILILTKEVRAELGKSWGENVKVQLELDTEERVVEIPKMLDQLFIDFPKAKVAFDELSYTKRKEYSSFISSAVRQETKEKRIQKILAELLNE